MNSAAVRWARRVVAIVAVLVFAYVLRDGFESGVRLSGDTAIRFAIAVPVSTLGLLAAAISWSELAGTSWRRGVASFGTSLPLRHLPLGGLGQIAGLAGLSISDGATAKRAAQAGPLFLLTTAAGASIIALPLSLDAGAGPLIRLGVALAGIGAIAFACSSRFVLTRLSRWRFAEGSQDLPIARSVGWSTIAALCAGVAFAILFPEGGSFLRSVIGFSAAWLGGFLLVIAPAGLGAREGILVSLWPAVDPAVVIAVALVHRVATLAGEGLILLIGLMLAKRTKNPSLERK